MLVKNGKQPRLRCGAIKVLSLVMGENSLPQATKDNLHLCNDVFAGLASSLRNSESDGFTEITLIELGLSSSVGLRDLRVYEDYSIVLPVVGLVQNKSSSVKLHIAQTVRILFVNLELNRTEQNRTEHAEQNSTQLNLWFLLKVFMQRNFTPKFYGLSVKLT